MFSTIGGIYEMVNVILSLLFGYLSRKMYLFYILDQVSKDEISLNHNYKLQNLNPDKIKLNPHISNSKPLISQSKTQEFLLFLQSHLKFHFPFNYFSLLSKILSL